MRMGSLSTQIPKGFQAKRPETSDWRKEGELRNVYKTMQTRSTCYTRQISKYWERPEMFGTQTQTYILGT
jgi:hypothetical protein